MSNPLPTVPTPPPVALTQDLRRRMIGEAFNLELFGHMAMPNYNPGYKEPTPKSDPGAVDPSIGEQFLRAIKGLPGYNLSDIKSRGTGDLKILSIENSGLTDAFGRPIYRANYAVEGDEGRMVQRVETFSLLPGEQGRGATVNLNPQRLPTPSEPERPKDFKNVGTTLERGWRIYQTSLVRQGVAPRAAAEMVEYARGIGIPVAQLQAMTNRASEASEHPGSGIDQPYGFGPYPGLGPALAKVWERNPEAAKQILQGEAFGEGAGLTFASGSTVAPVAPGDPAAAAAAGQEEFNPYDWINQVLKTIMGGMGGGRSRPVYQPPDRREVEDMVRGMLARTKGQPVESEVQSLTDMYMREDKRAFNNPTSGISPKAAVLERIRGGSDYKRIHQLRPDFVDEMEWINPRYMAAQRVGLNERQALDYAVGAAQVGATDEDVMEGASYETLINTGSANPFMRQKFSDIGRAMVAGLR